MLWLSIWSWWILLNLCWVSTFLDISHEILMSRTSIKRFLAEVSTNVQKMNYFENLRTIIKGRNKEIRQMTPFFHLPFELCLWYSFLYLKIAKIHFHGVFLLQILVWKIPEFWRCKLWDQNFVSFQSGHINIKGFVCYVFTSFFF